MNLREARLEVSRDPDRDAARYRRAFALPRDERVELAALPGALVAVAELLPGAR